MADITDEQMRETLTRSATYSMVILRQGPQYAEDHAKPIIWEHGRRNMSLRADGILNIVCPVTDDSPVCGVGIFDATLEQVDEIMQGDPGVAAGVFVYDVHPVRSFPGDTLNPPKAI
jgi:hypothetical protein